MIRIFLVVLLSAAWHLPKSLELTKAEADIARSSLGQWLHSLAMQNAYCNTVTVNGLSDRELPKSQWVDAASLLRLCEMTNERTAAAGVGMEDLQRTPATQRQEIYRVVAKRLRQVLAFRKHDRNNQTIWEREVSDILEKYAIHYEAADAVAEDAAVKQAQQQREKEQADRRAEYAKREQEAAAQKATRDAHTEWKNARLLAEQFLRNFEIQHRIEVYNASTHTFVRSCNEARMAMTPNPNGRQLFAPKLIPAIEGETDQSAQETCQSLVLRVQAVSPEAESKAFNTNQTTPSAQPQQPQPVIVPQAGPRSAAN